jgi:hypothetical protein
MHKKGFSYRVLRIEMVKVVEEQENENNFLIFLDSPDYTWNEIEKNYLNKYV